MKSMLINKPFELSIIIPVYNEVDNVEVLYQEIVAALPSERFIYEVIFIDDGSTDGTSERLKSLSQVHPHLRVLHHKKNFGQSAGLVSGAKIAQYPMLITLDGDGQNDPHDIPRLVEQRQDQHTIVLGIRKKRDDNF